MPWGLPHTPGDYQDSCRLFWTKSGCLQWRGHLPELTALWEVGEAVRKKISTTNAIENLHSQQRRYLKAHKMFPNPDSALRRMTGLARKLSDKYTSVTQRRGQWKAVVNKLHLLFLE